MKRSNQPPGNPARFKRSVKGMALTDAGQTFLRRARSIEAEWQDSLIELNAARVGARGTLAIGIGPTFAHVHMPKVLTAITERFPNLTITIRTGVGRILLPALERGEIALFAGGLPPDEGFRDQSFRSELLYEQRHVIVGAARDPAKLGARPSLAALAAARWVGLSYDSALIRRLEQLFSSHEEPAPRFDLSTTSLALALHLVRDSAMISAIPEPLYRSDALSFGLRSYEVPDLDTTIPIGITYRTSAARLEPVRHMITELRSAIS